MGAAVVAKGVIWARNVLASWKIQKSVSAEVDVP
jgi:hypothetical protein